LKRGVIVRPVAGYGLPEYLRVSVGLANQNARFLEALKAVL
jgi:histidinol-phosphate aminotransferase